MLILKLKNCLQFFWILQIENDIPSFAWFPFSHLGFLNIETAGHKNTICWDKEAAYIISGKMVQLLPVLQLCLTVCNVVQLRICAWKCYIAYWWLFHRQDKTQHLHKIAESFSLEVVLATSVSGAERHRNYIHYLFLTPILCTLILTLLKNLYKSTATELNHRGR